MRKNCHKTIIIAGALIGLMGLFMLSERAVAETNAEPAAIPAGQGNTNDILNGGFENWSARADVPTNWDVAGKMIPEKWGLEDRPGESGTINRIINNPDSSDASLGKYSLFLNGRLVSQHVYTNVAKKEIKISLMAKGRGGNLIVRLREYRNPKWGSATNDMFVNRVMEVINTPTGKEWQKYSSKAAIHLLPLIQCAASLEIIGQNVVVDCFKVELEEVDAKKAAEAIVYNIPVTAKPIGIDGEFSEEEWSNSSGANIGFINFTKQGLLANHQSEYYLSSDNTNLLIGLRTKFKGSLRQRTSDRDGNVWEDDSCEIHINPSAGQNKPPAAYQFIINSLGTVYDARINDGLHVDTNKDWNCAGLKVATKCRDSVWTVEMAIPLGEVGLQPDKEFGINICMNFKNPDEYSSLGGFGYFDYDKMILGRINKDSPSFFWGNNGVIGAGPISLFVRMANNEAQKQSYTITFAADTEKVAKKESRTLALAPATQETIKFNTDGNPGTFGEIKILAQNDADQKVIVTHRLNIETDSTAELTRAGNKILFYPVQNKIVVVLDNFPKQFAAKKPAKVNVSVLREKNLIKHISTDKIELVEDNGYATVEFTPPEEGDYVISAAVLDNAGDCLEYLEEDINVKKHSWLNNTCGKTDTINKPFIPLARSGKTVACLGRKYILAGSGLPEQIISQGENVLTAPVAFACLEGDAAKYGKNGTLKFKECSGQSVAFTGETLFDNFKIIAHGVLEYDGAIFYDIEIVPKQEMEIPRLRFEMPFMDLKYFESMACLGLWMSSYPAEGEYVDSSVPVWSPDCMYVFQGVRKHNSLYFPKGNGTIWNSKNIKGRQMPYFEDDFLPYLTFGNSRYGLCWFANNSRGWVSAPEKSPYEIIREGNSSKVIINLVAKPVNLKDARKISFALAATPVHPKKTGLNYFKFLLFVGDGGSSFIDGALGGLVIKDNFLLDKYLSLCPLPPASTGEKREDWPNFFYINKPYFPLGDADQRYFWNEWHMKPEYSYQMRDRIPTKEFGPDPDNYFAPAGCLYPERIDYLAFRIDRMFKDNPRLAGLYWDENYSVPCLDTNHKNCGFKIEDGTVKPGTQLYALRELDKRMQAILQMHGRSFPRMIVHNTELIPAVYAFGDINLVGEKGTGNLDFIDYWGLPRLENACAGAWGLNLMWTPQMGTGSQGAPNTPANNRAMLAALKLFDVNIWHCYCLPEILAKFRAIEIKFGIAEGDSQFWGYWQKENNQAVAGLPVFVKSSFFVRPGRGALVYISNLDKAKQTVKVKLDFSKWNINNFKVTDAETGQEIKLDGKTIALDIEGHDFRNLVIDQL